MSENTEKIEEKVEALSIDDKEGLYHIF